MVIPERYSPVDRFARYRLRMMESDRDGKDNTKSTQENKTQ